MVYLNQNRTNVQKLTNMRKKNWTRFWTSLKKPHLSNGYENLENHDLMITLDPVHCFLLWSQIGTLAKFYLNQINWKTTLAELSFISGTNGRGNKQKQQVLRKRRELIEKGVERSKIKIRSFKIFVDSKKVPLEEDTNQVSERLTTRNILVLNARSLLRRERCPAFANAILISNPKIFCVTETWLTINFSSSDTFLLRYTIKRAERTVDNSSSRHGGVLIGISSEFNFTVHDLSQFSSTISESFLWVSITIQDNELNICCLYNPPANSKCRIPQNELNDLFQQVSNTKSHQLCYIVGDLNLPNMDWESLSSPDEYEDKIAQTFSVLNWTQLIDFPTVGRRRHHELTRVSNLSGYFRSFQEPLCIN